MDLELGQTGVTVYHIAKIQASANSQPSVCVYTISGPWPRSKIRVTCGFVLMYSAFSVLGVFCGNWCSLKWRLEKWSGSEVFIPYAFVCWRCWFYREVPFEFGDCGININLVYKMCRASPHCVLEKWLVIRAVYHCWINDKQKKWFEYDNDIMACIIAGCAALQTSVTLTRITGIFVKKLWNCSP